MAFSKESLLPIILIFLLGGENVASLASKKLLLVASVSEGSVFAFMTRLANNLADRGHHVSVTLPDVFYQKVVGSSKLTGTKIETFYTGLSVGEAGWTATTDWLEKSLTGKMGWFDVMQFWDPLIQLCYDSFADADFLDRLQEQHFDLVVACDISPCGALLAHYLKRPFVLVADNRITPVWNADMYYIPNNPAYIPCIGTGLTDKMDFFERMYNLGYFFMRYITVNKIFAKFGAIKEKHNIRPELGIRDIYSDAELFLFNADWTVSFPRPLMPNVVFLGSGYHIEPPRALNKEFEEFVNSSAENGVVIFAFGSYRDFTEETLFRRFAMGLKRLPQKIIAKYAGDEPPGYLKNDTKFKLAKWVPQNDLLGHPKTKALVYHGGVNGMHEAIHHGVPVVGIPLIFDQFDNMQFMVEKGMAISLDVGTMTADDLYHAVTTVINNPTYKENALRLSRIQNDQPISPKDSSIFWIEYAIRNGGKHLRSQAFSLNFFQYYMIDVVAFLLVVGAIIVVIMIKLFCLFWGMSRNLRRQKGKRD